MIKRVVGIMILATGVLATSTACFESPEEQFKRECTESGGTVQRGFESDDGITYSCAMPGQSSTPAPVDD